ncbi:hypothetical protein CAPTEDRAFT_116953, partial [Capitella teleta]
QQTGLYAYKTYGDMKTVPPKTAAEVYMDYEYRKEWDSYVKELQLLSKEGETEQLYWQVNFPFPLWNRDYTFVRELRQFDLEDGRHVWVILAKGVDGMKPEEKGVVRVNGYIQSMALTCNGQGGTKAYMKYFDNPGGNIPTWLINWGAKTGVPKFLEQMVNACEKYNIFKTKQIDNKK